MIKTFDVLLDIEKDLYNPSNLLFTVSESDLDSIDLLFKITQDEKSLDLTGTAIELGIKKPSGLTVYQEVEITNALEGEATVRMSIQSYNEYGVYTAEVYIRGTDSLAVTSPFYYSSREAIMNDETLESTNDWSAFQELLFSYDKKPILTNGVPDMVPEYIGQMAFDTTGKRAFISNEMTVEGWQLFAAGEGGGGGIVYWNDVINKPLLFPSEPHTHLIADVEGLQAELDSKADVGTTAPAPITAIAWEDVTDKPLVFPPAAHTHAIADVTGLQAELDSKADETAVYSKTETYSKTEVDEITSGITQGGGTVVQDTLTSTSTTAALSSNQGRVLNETKSDINHNHNDLYSPIVHSHSIDDIESLSNILDSKVDDLELTNYAPIVHTHAIADVTGLQGQLDGKVDDGELTNYAPIVHTHAIADVSGLQGQLDGKVDDGELINYAPVVHNHEINDVTGLQAALDGKVDDGDLTGYAPIDHTHAIEDVAGLQGALDGKVDDADLSNYAPIVHTHTFDSITGKPLTYPASAHTHAIADVSGLQGQLDGKVDDAQIVGLASTGYVDAADNNILNNVLGGKKLWTGTTANYTAIATKDANTLYFVTG